MISYLRSTHYKPNIKTRVNLQPGSWIRCEKPNEKEKQRLIDLGIDKDILSDALDPHEVPRVELEDGWTYFITRLPDVNDHFNDFTTPILFALGQQQLMTVSRDDLSRLWEPFVDRTLAPTTQRTKFFMLMMDAVVRQYQNQVASINRQMRAATSDVQNLTSKDITTLTNYERKLNDYLDALDPTNTALEKILGGRVLQLFEDDRDLIEDLSIDIEQVISRCRSLLRTITNVRDSYRAVMDTRLNETIRILTVITVALTIPTMVAGLFGMNVDIPGDDNPMMFWEILGATVVAALLLGYYFLRRR